jgi:hypothetical protein
MSAGEEKVKRRDDIAQADGLMGRVTEPAKPSSRMRPGAFQSASILLFVNFARLAFNERAPFVFRSVPAAIVNRLAIWVRSGAF